MGRFFLPEEGHLVILSKSFWQQEFGSDPRAIGKTATINGGSFTIIGVLPVDVASPLSGRSDLWVPLTFDADEIANTRPYLWVIARLKGGVNLERAQAELRAMNSPLEQQHPELVGNSVKLVYLREALVGEIKLALLVLLGAVGFVLLLVCTNIATMLLARAAARHKA